MTEEPTTEDELMLVLKKGERIISARSLDDRARLWACLIYLLAERRIPRDLICNAFRYSTGWVYDDSKRLRMTGVPIEHCAQPPQIHAIMKMYANDVDPFVAGNAREVLLLVFDDFSVWDDTIRGFLSGEMQDKINLIQLISFGHQGTKEAMLRVAGESFLDNDTRQAAIDVLRYADTALKSKEELPPA